MEGHWLTAKFAQCGWNHSWQPSQLTRVRILDSFSGSWQKQRRESSPEEEEEEEEEARA